MAIPVSIEFFPPADSEGLERLLGSARVLAHALRPEYFSVTYGAGGTTREGTKNTVTALVAAGHEVAPHLSCGQDDDGLLTGLLDYYRSLDVRRIVALRGDTPSGLGRRAGIRHAANLVRFIRARYGDHFQIQVAAYPETHPDADGPSADFGWFKHKVHAGADGAITQYFYNPDAYADFMERCCAGGLSLPIVPGVMPITNYKRLVHFSTNCGAEIPRWILQGMAERREDPKALRTFGVRVVGRLCARLLEIGAPGLHFYTLNRTYHTLAICRALGLAQN